MPRIVSMLLIAFAIIAMTQTADARSNQSRRNAAHPEDRRQCLVLALYHEAGHESELSLWKHAWTIIWRVKRDDFPAELCDVVFSPWEFSAFNKGIRPLRNQKMLNRVERIVDQVLIKAFPDVYGGTTCAVWDNWTDNCVARVADMMRTPIGLTTHYAVADCAFLGRPGYHYIRTKAGDCVPRWSRHMKRVGSEPCALVKKRRCSVIWWKPT